MLLISKIQNQFKVLHQSLNDHKSKNFTDEDTKIINMIELYCKEVTPNGCNGKHHDNTKVLKDFINNHVSENHGLAVIFLRPSIKYMNYDAPKHEEKRR